MSNIFLKKKEKELKLALLKSFSPKINLKILWWTINGAMEEFPNPRQLSFEWWQVTELSIAVFIVKIFLNLSTKNKKSFESSKNFVRWTINTSISKVTGGFEPTSAI